MAAITHIKLQSSDNKIFDVEIAVAKKSVTIKTMLEELGMNDDDVPVPLPKVNAEILEKIIEWCTYHKDDKVPPEDDNLEKRTDDISEWDKKFVDVNHQLLFSIILAANYLDIKGLLDVACKTVANMVKGKSPDEISMVFKLDKDAADGGAEKKTGEKNTEASASTASASSSGAAKAQKIESPSATA